MVSVLQHLNLKVADLVKESQFDVYAQSSLYPFEEER